MTLKIAFNDVLSKYSGGPGRERTGGAEELPNTVFFLDISGSTFVFINRHNLFPMIDESQKNDARLRDGSDFIVATAISEGFGRLADGLEAPREEHAGLETMGAEKGLLDFLGGMMEKSAEHPYVVVTIGNPDIPAMVEETSNLKSTAKLLRDAACLPGTDQRQNITLGTSLVGSIKGVLSSPHVSRAKRDGTNLNAQRLHFFTDGQCSDSEKNTEKAFRDLFDVFPKAMVEIHAYVLNVKPNQDGLTEEALNKVAGVDMFQHINKTFSDNVSSVTINYLLQRNGSRYTIAEQPDTLLLAVGQGAGASMTFTYLEAKVAIPKDNVVRNQMVLELIDTLIAHPEGIAAMKPPDMKETLDNLVTLAKYMSQTVLQNALAALVTKWFCAMNPQATYTKNQLNKDAYEFLQRYIFVPRQNALLEGHSGVQLRTQETRQANFKTILHFWNVLKNPVIYAGYAGTQIVLINKDDVRHVACVTLTEDMLRHYDNEALLFFGKFIPIPSNEGTADYFRMAVRRILARVAWKEGVRLPKMPDADKMSISPHMVACVARLSAEVRRLTNRHGGQLLSEALMNATVTMLQKEQIDHRSKDKRTLPSCYQMLQKDEGIPNEYAVNPMLQPDPASLLLYASGLSDAAPPAAPAAAASTAPPIFLEQPKIVDMILYGDIEDLTYYRYKDRDEYVSEEGRRMCLGRRSHLGGLYTEGDFTRVTKARTDAEEFERWMERSSEAPKPFASLFA